MSRPINLGRNHWELHRSQAPLSRICGGRPINLGRNHWEHSYRNHGHPRRRKGVAPLTWGGIIGNALSETRHTFCGSDVAPLTWGGIIGN